jgi:4-amino-4-deoxy-L-arabinose transferase-like glycosyltransferase
MQIPTRVHTVLVVLVLVLGFALRLSQPSLVEFKRDEATITRLGQAVAFEGYRPAVGVDSSLGIDNLPLTLYLVALPLRLWSDPLSAVIFTCLLNSLALVACYGFTRAALGRGAALIATLLFSISPWAVLYARKIWSRTLPLFTLAFAISLYLTFVRRKSWSLVGAFVSLTGLLGLQLEALAFAGVLLLAIVIYRDSVDWRAVGVGVFISVLLVSPYLVHDAQQGWPNAAGLLKYVRGDGAWSLDALRYTLRLLGSAGIEGQAGVYHRSFAESVLPLWWVNDLLSVLLVLGSAYAMWEAFRGRDVARRRTFGLFLLWLLVPIALQVKPSAPTQPHYFVMHYPAQFIVIAAFLVRLGGWVRGRLGGGPRRRSLWTAAAGGLLILCVWQVAVTFRLRSMMLSNPTTGGYGIPLLYSRSAARLATDLAAGGEIVVLTEDPHPFLAEAPTVFDALLFGRPHRFSDATAAIPFPDASRVAYLIAPLPGQDALTAAPGLERLVALPSVTPGPRLATPDGWAYETLLWQGDDRTEVTTGMVPLTGGAAFANDVVFAAYDRPDSAHPGTKANVWLAWWLRETPTDPTSTHFTVQILDTEGRLQAQDDHAGFPIRDWRGGDLVLSRFVLSLPEEMPLGRYAVRAGMYTYPETHVVPVVDPAGSPINDAADLGYVNVVGQGP